MSPEPEIAKMEFWTEPTTPLFTVEAYRAMLEALTGRTVEQWAEIDRARLTRPSTLPDWASVPSEASALRTKVQVQSVATSTRFPAIAMSPCPM